MRATAENDFEREWDRLLEESPSVRRGLERGQMERGLTLDGDPLCPVARPRLLSPFRVAADMAAAETVTAALVHATDVLRSTPELRRRYLADILEDFGHLVEHDPGTPSGPIVGRLDGFRLEGDLSFVEYNTEGVAAHSRADAVAGVFARTVPMDHMRSEHFVSTPASFADLVRTLRDLHAELRGGEELTTVHILDLDRHDRSRQHVVDGVDLDEEWFAAHGLTCLRADPRSLEWDGSALTAEGVPVRAALRSFFLGEVKDLDSIEQLRKAERAGAVTLLNPLSTVVHGVKAMLAAVTDPQLDLGLPGALRQAVSAHVPWTRIVIDEASTNPEGDRVDLLAWTAYNREDLVLKPSLGHGGADVLIGRLTEAGEWQRALLEADADGRTWVVQAAVPVRMETFPLLGGGCGEFLVDVDPLLHRGRHAGTLRRISTDPISDVARGGRLLPSFVVD